MIDTARALEGLRREDSVHAAGVVIGDRPLVDYLPLKLSKDSRDDAKKMVTQFDMNGVAALGLLKMDFLGLRNLSVIEETLRHLRAAGIDLDIDAVPLDDDPTYAMLRRGDTIGVFQMESPGVKNLIKLLEPDRFEDLMACVALYRPGPLNNGLHTKYAQRKHGREAVTYAHPSLEPALANTYGVIVYQEQIMQIAVTVAGYSMGQADTLRKVMAKKRRELVGAERERFVAGCVAQGHTNRLAVDLFDLIEPFADYGFPAAHACAYGFIAYQTAYLMAHHPVEYMAAIFTSVKDDKDRKPFYLYACRSMRIDVLPPDVNGSDLDFAPDRDKERAIRFGLSAVRNVGEGAVRSVLEAREAGPFTSFADFCRRVDPGVLTKRVLESLVYAGAFDSLGYTRGGLLQGPDGEPAFEKVSRPILAERQAEAAGQFSLFGGHDEALDELDESVLEGPELPKRLLLSKEKEMLGQFVTDHPLLGVEGALRAKSSHEIRDLADLGDGDLVTVGGIIGSLARKYTKRGEPYAQLRLEGLAGGVEVVAFPSVYERAPELMETDRIVLVSGRIDLRGRELQIRATAVHRARPRRRRRAAGRGARRRPAGRRVHAGRPGQAEGPAGGAPGRSPGAPAVPVLPGRDAAGAGGLPRAPRFLADGRDRGVAGRAGSAAGARARRLRPPPVSFARAVHAPARDRLHRVEARAVHAAGARRRPRPSAAIPSRAARAFSEAGATWLHVVDMDLAFTGRVANAGVDRGDPRRLSRRPAPGERRRADVVRRRGVPGRGGDAGRGGLGGARATRMRPPGCSTRLGPAAVVGIEVEEGRIRSRGADPVDLDLMATVGWLVQTGAPAFLATAVARVAGLEGPDGATVRRVARSGRPTLAAGGISLGRGPGRAPRRRRRRCRRGAGRARGVARPGTGPGVGGRVRGRAPGRG